MLTDSFNRFHDYLRISLTDQCNFSCVYCKPEHYAAHAPKMSAGEIISIADTFISSGVRKIRLTGGEPLFRKDFREIISRLSRPGLELTLTTNGLLIDKYINDLKQAGIHSLNVSLDTLKASRFKEIVKQDHFQKVFENIHLLLWEGFHVKLNVVAIRGMNEDEITDFVALTRALPLHVRFIELMPFAGNHWQPEKVISFREMLEVIENRYRVLKLEDDSHDTTKKFFVPGHKGTFAFISTITSPFCSGCNRLRLTSDGKLKNCLFSKTETDLLTPLRQGEDIIPIIRNAVMAKKASRGGQFDEKLEMDGIENRSMIAIGG